MHSSVTLLMDVSSVKDGMVQKTLWRDFLWQEKGAANQDGSSSIV